MKLICTVRRLNGAADQFPVEIDDPALTDLETLMVLIEVESGIPTLVQQIFHRGKRMQGASTTLLQLGITSSDSDGIEVRIRGQTPPPPQPLSAAPQPQATASDPNELIRSLFSAPLPPAAAAPDPAAIITALFNQPPAPPQLHPEDPDYQRRVYEEIQRANLEQNLVQALEYTPEAFARVVMLYVPCEVNKVPVTAFVDSGAQMSIMNVETAERCGIMRLLDRRMQGTAVGVGTSKILGRIHMTLVNLGGLHIPFSISVLEGQKMEFLIGLDQLKRHQMCIDLEKNCLRVQEREIPFLSEGELPAHFRDEAVVGDEHGVQGVGQSQPAGSAAPAPQLTAAQESMVSRLTEISAQPRDVVLRALQTTDWDEASAAALLIE